MVQARHRHVEDGLARPGTGSRLTSFTATYGLEMCRARSPQYAQLCACARFGRFACAFAIAAHGPIRAGRDDGALTSFADRFSLRRGQLLLFGDTLVWAAHPPLLLATFRGVPNADIRKPVAMTEPRLTHAIFDIREGKRE